MSRLARGSDRRNDASGLSSDGLSSSTLRARLSSQGPPTAVPAPSSQSPDAQLQLGDLRQHFRACFVMADSSTLANPQLGGKKSTDTNDGDVLAQLRESVAQAGLKLHASVVKQLSQAQGHIVSNISDFSQLSSSILSDLDDLYSNLVFPLSATICHSTTFARATIATHISNVQKQLKHTEGELRGLRDEWEANLGQENRFREELVNINKETAEPRQTSRPSAHRAGDQPTVESFRDEAERIVEDKIQALDDIEMQYKEWLQAETMEMMQFILAD